MNELLTNLKGGVKILNDFDELIKEINQDVNTKNENQQEPKKQKINLHIQNISNNYIHKKMKMKYTKLHPIR